MGKRERYSSVFKSRVAIEAIKEKETLRELSERFNVSIMTISKWKSEFLENSAKVFDSGQFSTDDKEKEIEQLHTKIGQLTMERDFFVSACKKAGLK